MHTFLKTLLSCVLFRVYFKDNNSNLCAFVRYITTFQSVFISADISSALSKCRPVNYPASSVLSFSHCANVTIVFMKVRVVSGKSIIENAMW